MIQRNVPKETGSKVYRAEAEARQDCRALECTAPHSTFHTAGFALLSSTRTNLVDIGLCNGKLKVDSEWKQTLWPGECVVFQFPTAFIRALGKEDNHNNLYTLSFYKYDLILPREHHKSMLTIIQTPTSE